MATALTTQQKLDEALAARHALLVGKAKVSIGFGERRVEYTSAEIARLDTYIAELRRDLAGKARRRGAINYFVPD